MSFENPQTMNINEALAIIQGTLGETMAMGANDTEFQAIQLVITGVTEGTITPEEGVLRARAIRDSKNAYH